MGVIQEIRPKLGLKSRKISFAHHVTFPLLFNRFEILHRPYDVYKISETVQEMKLASFAFRFSKKKFTNFAANVRSHVRTGPPSVWYQYRSDFGPVLANRGIFRWGLFFSGVLGLVLFILEAPRSIRVNQCKAWYSEQATAWCRPMRPAHSALQSYATQSSGLKQNDGFGNIIVDMRCDIQRRVRIY